MALVFFCRRARQGAAPLLLSAMCCWWPECGIAAMFFRAGRTKVGALLTITDSTFDHTDPAVPFMNPRARGACRNCSEHHFPVFSVLGLLTRPVCHPLFGMSSVLEVLVHPDAWPTPLS